MGNFYSKYENLEEGFIKYNNVGDILYCNKKIPNIFKYPDGCKPKSIYDLMEDSKKDSHKYFLRNTATKTMSNKNITGVCYDKTIINLDIIILPRNTLIVTISKTESLRTYKNILMETEDLCLTGYWYWDIKSGNLEWSTGLKNIFEIDDVSFDTYMSCIHLDDKETLNNVIEKCLRDKKDYTVTHRLISHKTKKIKWLRSIGKYSNKDMSPCLFGVAQDISEQKHIEEELKIKSKKAEENLKIKSDFVSSVSHELRTPLNGIVGMVSLLQCTELTKKQQKYITVLHNSCGVLLSIINNILDFSKIESGKLSVDISLFDVEKSLTKIIDLFKPTALTKNIRINLSFDMFCTTILSDQIKITQILTNLLSNSLKFTQKGHVDIKIIGTENTLSLLVTDTGIGIHGDFLNKITSPFTQADSSTTRNYGGSGLGLSIVKSYVDILKGSIAINSTLGKGTNIEISIPIKNNKNCDTIVVVEDNLANQYIVREMISEIIDKPIICYENGVDAIENITIQPLIIFMDLHMPQMDGHTTTKKLRERGFSCPIIALTANSLKNERIRCLESGMDDFLLKPIDITDIRMVLQKYKLI